jgi:HAD superfamily hydrolase (TIGR01509 family)
LKKLERENIFLPPINSRKVIKNIIFDFGGVILNIDYNKPEQEFTKLGIENFHDLYSKARQSHLFDDFEKGLVSPEEFRERLRIISEKPLTNEEIDYAWNSILIDLPEQNVAFLQKLKTKNRLFLLSNTNAIHEAAFRKIIIRQYGSYILDGLFEKIYFSHHIHRRKPDKEIFQFVINENKLIAAETLFIDDSPQNIEGSKKTGLQAMLVENRKKMMEELSRLENSI